MIAETFIRQLDEWGDQRIPFLFLVDFEMKKPLAFRLDNIPPEIFYNVNGNTNAPDSGIPKRPVTLNVNAIGITAFKNKFSDVMGHLEYGDSYLTNLTIRTPIVIDLPLLDLFTQSKARYKLLFRNEFLVFSPEIFVQIRQGRIFSYPMKGTIDASFPGASDRILNDHKELAEHVTIVDLIRNDLSMISDNVTVSRFRYLEEIKTNDKTLLQVSSEIIGDLPADYRSHLGTLLFALLPAGSVSGAPKPKTLEIIRKAEKMDRGYYTGVMGIFDGENFDSGVMIRYIERDGQNLFYRSGGGITTQSIMSMEYQEAIDKIYVPLN